MTDRISLCINNQITLGGRPFIKPLVIADIENGQIRPPKGKKGQAVKTDNNVTFSEDKISVWSWDDSGGYLLNKDITDNYRLVF